MNIERLTKKSQEAVEAAQRIATRYGHTQVDGEHLLQALLDQEGGLAVRLFEKMDVPLDRLRERLESELERLPRVSGTGVEPGKVYITPRLQRLLVDAQDAAERLKDEYVSVEHLLIAFLEEGTTTPAGRVLSESGITQDVFLKALTGVRGTQRVTSADPEATYEALEKYGRDLVKAAEDGKLDPVIGRDEEIPRSPRSTAG